MAGILNAAGLPRVIGIGRSAVDRVRAAARDQIPTVRSGLHRRAVHASVYEKNLEEEEVRPTVVPDNVMDLQSDKYWGPHPKTGIFGPPDQHHLLTSASASHGGRTVLDQTAWFRHLEEVDKSSFA